MCRELAKSSSTGRPESDIERLMERNFVRGILQHNIQRSRTQHSLDVKNYHHIEAQNKPAKKKKHPFNSADRVNMSLITKISRFERV